MKRREVLKSSLAVIPSVLRSNGQSFRRVIGTDVDVIARDEALCMAAARLASTSSARSQPEFWEGVSSLPGKKCSRAYLAVGSCNQFAARRKPLLHQLSKYLCLSYPRRTRAEIAVQLEQLWSHQFLDNSAPAFAYGLNIYVPTSTYVKGRAGYDRQLEFRPIEIVPVRQRNYTLAFNEEQTGPPLTICLDAFDSAAPLNGPKSPVFQHLTCTRTMVDGRGLPLGKGTDFVTSLIPYSVDDGRMLREVSQGKSKYRYHQLLQELRDDPVNQDTAFISINLVMFARFQMFGRRGHALVNQLNIGFHPTSMKHLDINLHSRTFSQTMGQYVGFRSLFSAAVGLATGS